MALIEPRTEPNIPLLRKAVEWVEEQDKLPTHRRTWRQATWYQKNYRTHSWQTTPPTCHTAMCVAGYVCEISGEVEIIRHELDSEWLARRNGRVTWIAEAARDLLGLRPTEASVLFQPTNDAVAIRRIAEKIAEQRL